MKTNLTWQTAFANPPHPIQDGYGKSPIQRRMAWIPSPRSEARGEGQGAPPLTQNDNVMFLNVQSKYNLLLHWGCKTTSRSRIARWRSSHNSVNRSPLRRSGAAIGVGPVISRGSGC